MNDIALGRPASQGTIIEQSRAVAEVAAAVRVAQDFPRDTERAFAEMEAACSRLSMASRSFYSVRNRGDGPTVHLARELGRIWGNIDYGVRELARDDLAGTSEIQAFAWDQQTNVRSTRTFIVPHVRMAGGARKPLTDVQDIYLNNQNIGARAVRECIFTILPVDFADQAQKIARATLEHGEGVPLPQRIDEMVTAYGKASVTQDQLEAKIGRPRASWTAQDCADMHILFESLRRREVTKDEAFPPARVDPAELTGQTPPDEDPALNAQWDQKQTGGQS